MKTVKTLQPFGNQTTIPSAIKFAKKHGVFISTFVTTKVTEVRFFLSENDMLDNSKAAIVYTSTDSKGMFFKSCGLDNGIKEELANWLDNAEKLKELIMYLSCLPEIVLTAFYPNAEGGLEFKSKSMVSLKRDVLDNISDVHSWKYSINGNKSMIFTRMFKGVNVNKHKR